MYNGKLRKSPTSFMSSSRFLLSQIISNHLKSSQNQAGEERGERGDFWLGIKPDPAANDASSDNLEKKRADSHTFAFLTNAFWTNGQRETCS